MSFFDPSASLLSVLGLLALGVKLWALVDACIRPAPRFPVAGKLTKPIWIAILAVALLLSRGDVLGLFGIVGLVAAIVYLVDVRPAVRDLRSGGSSW